MKGEGCRAKPVRSRMKSLSIGRFCLLPSAFNSAFCLLPSAFCLLPSAFCLLPLILPSAFNSVPLISQDRLDLTQSGNAVTS